MMPSTKRRQREAENPSLSKLAATRSIGDHGPAVARVEAVDVFDDIAGGRPEVGLVDDAVLVDGEGFYAGLAIFGRPGDEAEAGDHVAVDDIVVGAAGDLGALAGQDLVLVAEIALAFGGVVELGLVEVARRALAIDVVGRPVEPVGRAFAS